MQNKSCQNNKYLNAIKSVVAKTDIEFEKYTGASVSSVYSGSAISYKISLFFGYKDKKPLTRTFKITKESALEFLDAAIKVNELLFTDDLLSFPELSEAQAKGSKTVTDVAIIKKPKPKPKAAKIPEQIEIAKQEILQQGIASVRTLDLLIEHRNNLTKDGKLSPAPLNTARKMAGLISAIIKFAKHFEISESEALNYYLSQNWQSIAISYGYDKPQEAKIGTTKHVQQREDSLNKRKIKKLRELNPDATNDELMVLLEQLLAGKDGANLNEQHVSGVLL